MLQVLVGSENLIMVNHVCLISSETLDSTNFGFPDQKHDIRGGL